MTDLIELFCVETGVSAETIMRIVNTGPKRYKVYDIPKRNGGTRTIAHPARELKLLQRIFLRQILDKITVSSIATAYVKGRGIKFNADQHKGARWILKLDFANFFNSIVPVDWDRVVRRTPELEGLGKQKQLLHYLLFWGRERKRNIPTCLSIGAPTSPSISNLVCLKLDEWMTIQADRLGLKVTRYADDITVSGDTVTSLLKFEASLKVAIEKGAGFKLTFNDEKRGLYGPGERHMVTGLVLTPDGKVSIGRDRKREISALIHQFSLSKQVITQSLRTRGLLAFAMSADPAFVESMTSKYGRDVLSRLMAIEPNLDIEIDLFE